MTEEHYEEDQEVLSDHVFAIEAEFSCLFVGGHAKHHVDEVRDTDQVKMELSNCIMKEEIGEQIQNVHEYKYDIECSPTYINLKINVIVVKFAIITYLISNAKVISF